MRHAVIMAGGAGTRLWPLSRRQRPKHFLRLIEGQSLLRLSYERLAHFLPPENICVITSGAHLDLVARELPEVPRANLFGEPAVRDTANAVGLSAVLLQQRDADGIMGIFTADHIITPVERFTQALETAYSAAARHPQALITLGIKPTRPHTGYGYVQRARQVEAGLFGVGEFKEKPDLPTAERYLASGDYYWNSGMFVWRIQAILEQLARHLPHNHAQLQTLHHAGSPADQQALIEQLYPNLQKISIDYAVMEKADQVLVCEMNCAWLDVGAWSALAEILGGDDHGNVHAHRPVITVDASNNVFVGEDDHLLAAVGVNNLVIVRAGDATLICHQDHVQQIKALVGQFEDRYL